MEQSETRNTQQCEYQQRVKHWQRVLIEELSRVEYPISNHATEHNNGTVNQKDTPVWQRILREIPVQYLVKRISHSLLNP
jgi:hypothetical protein